LAESPRAAAVHIELPSSLPPPPPPQPLAFRPLEADRYHVFLTHTWIHDGQGRDTHERVRLLSGYLQTRGVACWFDSDRMQGSIRRLMTSGIDCSLAMVVFLTRAYVDKVNGEDDGDNCRYEFTYGVEQKGPQNMVRYINIVLLILCYLTNNRQLLPQLLS
jgi:hypothetical protein